MSTTAAVTAGRTWAATRFPYLASAVFAASVVPRPGLGRVTADPQWRVYVDPELLARWTPAQLGSAFVHHACHLLRDHAVRAERLGVDASSAGAWLDAADAEINDDLVPGGIDLATEATLPEDLGCPAGLLAEQYFVPEQRARAHADCGSVVDGLDREYEDAEPGLDMEALRLLQFRVATDCRRLADEPGTVPVSWQRWASTTLAPRLPWTRLLAAEVRRCLHATAGALDYSYRRPSRRATVLDRVVLPSLVSRTPEVAIVIDTSGSMGETHLRRALTETIAILDGCGLSARRTPLITCDVVPRELTGIRRGHAVELYGGGGTDLRAGLAYACARRPPPDVVIVLTDGRTPWPATPPKPRIVVALIDGRGPEPPAWARTVRLELVSP